MPIDYCRLPYSYVFSQMMLSFRGKQSREHLYHIKRCNNHILAICGCHADRPVAVIELVDTTAHTHRTNYNVHNYNNSHTIVSPYDRNILGRTTSVIPQIYARAEGCRAQGRNVARHPSDIITSIFLPFHNHNSPISPVVDS